MRPIRAHRSAGVSSDGDGFEIGVPGPLQLTNKTMTTSGSNVNERSVMCDRPVSEI